AQPALVTDRVAATSRVDSNLDVESDRADLSAACVDEKTEAKRRHRRLRDRRDLLERELELGRSAGLRHAHGGEMFGIRGSIGPCLAGLIPVERSAVEVPSGR